jgi:6-pyruvoyltetrahydropterin/6-carboxytetrahydropterin synthase
MKVQVQKTYGHERGYTTTFRQWRAKSHCAYIHGYALAFSFTFECDDSELDENGWVIDFGGLKPLKAWLDQHFDHKFLVAHDDPALELFLDLGNDKKTGKLVDPIVVKAVGCENFARLAGETVQDMLSKRELGETKAHIVSVEVREHGSNAAIWFAADRGDSGIPARQSAIRV